MSLFKKKERYRVFDGDSFELYKYFAERKWAKLKGEELKLSNDARRYRVTREEDGFALWIH